MLKKRRKKKKDFPSKRFLYIVIFILLAVIGVQYSGKLPALSKHIPQWASRPITVFGKEAPALTAQISDLEIPARLYDREEQIIRHTGFTVSYNEFLRLPNWVAYELTRRKTQGKEGRAKHFKPDPQVIGVSATNQDYARSGYDRGHMAPAADMKWNAQAMQESFYFSNISPQIHNLNAGDWKELEEKVREWAVRDSALYIVTGPVATRNPRRIGVRQVAVPDAFYKVILSAYGNRPRAIGFIFKNRKGNKPLRSYAVTVDSVEALTGIDFFPSLPAKIEKEVEAAFNLAEWDLN